MVLAEARGQSLDLNQEFRPGYATVKTVRDWRGVPPLRHILLRGIATFRGHDGWRCP